MIVTIELPDRESIDLPRYSEPTAYMLLWTEIFTDHVQYLDLQCKYNAVRSYGSNKEPQTTDT